MSVIAFCLRHLVEPAQMGPMDKESPYLGHRILLSSSDGTYTVGSKSPDLIAKNPARALNDVH
jgi:hypothetical protein